MKTLFITLLLFIVPAAFGQLFLTLEPAFLRPGLLYNHNFTNYGLYTHAWYGNIQGVHDDGGRFYTDNIKAGAGISTNWNLKTYFGLNYNHFFNTVTDDRIVQLERIKKVSFEIGISFKSGRVSGLMMTDILNWESMVGISYTLRDKRCPVYAKKHKR